MPQPAEDPGRLTTRSVVLSILLGVHPAQAPVRGLLKVAVALGFRESAVRVALTRMVAAGDLERVDGGVYRLSPRLIERQQRQNRAVDPALRAWNGDWSMVITTAPAEDAAARAAFRDSLLRRRYGELREGVWLRPDNLTRALPDLSARAMCFSGRPAGDPQELADRIFDTAGWAARGKALLSGYRARQPLSDRLAIAALMVRHTLDDPLLPDELLPADWPGRELRDTYLGYRTEFAEFAGQLLDMPITPAH